MGTELERSIYSLIEDAASHVEQPDTTAIADRVLGEMSVEELRHYAGVGVRGYVRGFFANTRKSQRASNGNGSGSARWDAVKADQSTGELDLARYSVFTGRSRKWLLDCNAEDLHGAAEYHREIGDHHHAASEQLTNLATTLKRKQGAEVVGDLPETKVKGLLSA